MYVSYKGTCSNGNVHLVGSPDITSGHVEERTNNYWGTVCDDYWNDNTATVVCKMSGFPSSNKLITFIVTNSDVIATSSTDACFGEGSSSILLYRYIQCAGNEASIFSCIHNIYSNNCSPI